MVTERPNERVVLVRGAHADAELPRVLAACGARVETVSADAAPAALEAFRAGTIIVELDGASPTDLGALVGKLPVDVRVIAIGSLAEFALAPGATPADCALFARPDEETLRAVLGEAPPVDTEVLLDELVALSVLGPDRAESLSELAIRVARAFTADDCIVLLSQEATCFTARQDSDEVIASFAPLCETVCQLATTLVAPPQPDRPYRAFLGVPLAYDNAPPVASLVLCREKPVPFHRDARRHLRRLAHRLATDLSWRLVQERLLADRDKLRDLSRIDPVLGVANRAALQEELSPLVSSTESAGEPFSVAVIDVDGLRLVNERSGYPAGDAVLAHVATAARKTLRAQDVVARYAGDSVAIILPGLAVDGATESLTRILSAIDAEPLEHEGKLINLTVSAGIAELRYDQDTAETALARAMAARQSARLHGEVIAVADSTIAADIPAQPDFAIGTTLGGVYQIRHEISRGAFGVVYRAEDLALGRQVALKLLRPDLARDTAFVERFRTEAATLARLRNPNLVQVYAFGIDGSNVYFAMELVEGQGLDERIASARKRSRHLPLQEVMSTIDQVANALEAVHQAGVLHRDVKPENVLIDRIHRRCVLVDVGIAVRRGSEKNPAGTPGFTAPEVFGALGESPATDVYSLGALAYLLLTLRAPFGDASPVETLALQAERRPPPLTEVRRDLPPGVDAVLLPSLDPDPRLRPQSARALAKSLSDALAPAFAPESRRKPRMTLEPPEAQKDRPVTFRNASLRNAPSTDKSTRGVMFRSAYEALGARRGSAWLAEIQRKVPELAAAFAPQGSPLSWYPTKSFVAALESLASHDQDARAVAEQLGRIAIVGTFAHFYGADPSAVSPAQVLRAAATWWRAYHTWGTATITAQDGSAQVTLAESPRSALLCASSAGLLGGVVSHAGGVNVRVEHPACVVHGAPNCLFKLAWRAR